MLSDTSEIVSLTGRILDAKTNRPIQAKIKYELLPNGNVTGIRNFEGAYQITLQPNYTYNIQVISENYLPLEVVITTSPENRLENDFYLHQSPQEGGMIELPEQILFERGKADIEKSSHGTLHLLIQIMEENPGMVIQLEGHTDKGARESLMSLSEERVKSVKKYLEKQGIHKKRIKTKAFGGTRPLSEENTPEAHSLNRRVEIRILKL